MHSGAAARERTGGALPELIHAVRRPGLHLHAYRPQDIADLADRSGSGVPEVLAALRAAGVRTIPGTGVKVLSERVRAQIAPTDLDTVRWQEIVEAAHHAGLKSSSVLFYGHVETAQERIAHLLRLRDIAERTAGSRSSCRFLSPATTSGSSRSAATKTNTAPWSPCHDCLGGAIRHLQIPWTRHGRERAAVLLGAGADDLGGTLLDGRVRPDAGIEHGLELPVAAARRLVAPLLRTLRLRATDYAEPGRSE